MTEDERARKLFLPLVVPFVATMWIGLAILDAHGASTPGALGWVVTCITGLEWSMRCLTKGAPRE